MGRNRYPWVFPFWEFGFFSGSSWLLVYIPESHENLQRIFARPFSRRSKKSSAKLWQLGVGQWQWLTPPQKKKHLLFVWKSGIYIYVYIYIHINLLFVTFLFVCLHVYVFDEEELSQMSRRFFFSKKEMWILLGGRGSKE